VHVCAPRTSRGWSELDATDGAAGGAVASAALRPRSPVAVPDHSRPVGGTGSRRTGATRRPARPCSRCRPDAGFTARIASHDTIHPLQPALPAGLDSWAQVFTDLRVSAAFDASPVPRCMLLHPELAAPFVAEIGAAIREKQLHRRPVEALVRRESVVEPVHDRIGGPNYIALREAMESAQKVYFAGYRSTAGGYETASQRLLRAEVDRFQSAYSGARRQHEPFVAHARHTAAKDYWTKVGARGLDDAFFNDLPADSTAARISRIEPAWWWRSFFQKLQTECADHHAADGRLVDEMPSLRASAGKKKLAATVADWCESRADVWGWDAPRHYRMLTLRAGPKAKTLERWFDERAPGYLRDRQQRQALHAALSTFLGNLDPMEKLIAVTRNAPSEHWRN